MATRMLIDARHPEETRVAVLKGNRIEEFDFESAEHKQIKGNIYLAKVTRVEPSLQAAFVDFGGNRHGFLAFSEIHPDYYQIPQSDRDALIQAEREHAEEEAALRAAEEEAFDEILDEDEDDDLDDHDEADDDDLITDAEDETDEDRSDTDDSAAQSDAALDADDAHENNEGDSRSNGRRGRPRRQGRQGRAQTKEMDELREKRQALRRRYKIQDVIQRRQVLLVQVVKEERGNKGAALTTYLSLAGRYCVLMPNSSSGGGISRKISSSGDRKRLKQIVSELSLPRSMGLIVRTAGLQRTKTEIKRDFDYLARLWDDIREKTMSSSAPSAIHSDSDLIKRAIRDIYNRDIEEVIVEGEAGYRAARTFMRLLMPSHVRKVKAYSDPVPLFQRFGAEDQLSAMYDPVVQLKSGGYLVINPTEALVSIDINSGRSTKELGIEQTAVATNMEAANEIARQLRLRDMAGLVVIDFIDMEYGSNVRKVEKCMREALKNDRARIQVGRISSFGLMEMSRQRLRTGVLEATTRSCPHCDGTGLVRTASSAGLSALRFIEDEAAKGKGTIISLFASTEAAVYLLNAKRADLSEIEHRYGVEVEVIPEGENEGAKMRVASSGPRPLHAPRFDPIVFEDDDDDLILEDEEFEDEEAESEANAFASAATVDQQGAAPEGEEGDGRRKRRRRRRGGRGRNRQREGEEGSWSQDNGEHESIGTDENSSQSAGDDEHGEDVADDASEGQQTSTGRRDHDDLGEEGTPRKRRRRGGRRRRRSSDESSGDGDQAQENEVLDSSTSDDAVQDSPAVEVAAPAAAAVEAEAAPVAESSAVEAPAVEEAVEPAPKPKRTRRKKVEPAAVDPVTTAEAPAAEAETVPADTVEPAAEEAPKPKRVRRKKADTETAEAATPATEDGATEEAPKPKRTRRKKADADGAEAAPAKASAKTPAKAAAKAPAKPRASRAKAATAKAAAPEVTPATEAPVTPAPAESTSVEASAEGASEGAPRRGWWQRTFGA